MFFLRSFQTCSSNRHENLSSSTNCETKYFFISGVGTVSAAAIQEWCTNPFNVQLVSRIKESGFAPTFKDPEIEKQTIINASSDSALQKKTSKTPRAKKLPSKKSEVKSEPPMEDPQNSPPEESSEMEGTEEIVEQPPLQGKNVVITGEFENYSREELEQLVILNGGQIRKSVSFSLHNSCWYYASLGLNYAHLIHHQNP